jgi:hypothetical protein
MTATSQVIKYNAVRLGWYPTSNVAKLWITELQMKIILAGVWKLKIKAQTTFNTMLHRITVHTLIQLFDLTGIRQESVLDDHARHRYLLGVFLRWHHVTIKLVDYTSDNQPIFIVYGKAPPSKTAKANPEQGSMPFMMVSGRHNHEFSVDCDLTVGFVALAILQNSMGPNLMRAVFDHDFGRQLLNNSSDKTYTFTCKSDYNLSPVFIKPTTRNCKHTSDRTPLGSYRPFNCKDFYEQLKTIGKLVGFQDALSYTCLRRSYNMKRVLSNSFPSWRLAMNMGHMTKNKKLHRKTYRSTILPMNQMLLRFGRDAISTSEDRHTSNLGSITTRPNPDLFSPEKRQEIQALVLARANAGNEDEENKENDSREVRAVSDEEIISAYRELNAGVPKSLKDSLTGLCKFAEGDDWASIVRQEHPYVQDCKNELLKVFAYLVKPALASESSQSVISFNTSDIRN